MRGAATVRSPLRRLVTPLGAAAALAALASGCGGSSTPKTRATTVPPGASTTVAGASAASTTAAPSSTVPATTVPATAATTTTVPAGPGPCPTSQLQFALTNNGNAAGSTYVILNLLNNGQSTCTLSGYPGVSYVTGDTGTQVGAPAQRDSSTPLSTVALAPGHSAQSSLRLVNPYNFDPAACQITAVRGFRVYPPGQTAAGFVSDPGNACSNPSLPQPTLFVGAVTAAATG